MSPKKAVRPFRTTSPQLFWLRSRGDWRRLQHWPRRIANQAVGALRLVEEGARQARPLRGRGRRLQSPQPLAAFRPLLHRCRCRRPPWRYRDGAGGRGEICCTLAHRVDARLELARELWMELDAHARHPWVACGATSCTTACLLIVVVTQVIIATVRPAVTITCCVP